MMTGSSFAILNLWRKANKSNGMKEERYEKIKSQNPGICPGSSTNGINGIVRTGTRGKGRG